MEFFKSLLFTFFIICSGIYNLNGQCGIMRNIPLIDFDTTNISVLVDGLINDQLAGSQGLCGVNLEFRHEFVGDIMIELISPANQKIQLIGPGLDVSGSTSFTRWNVLFIPCGAVPSPDLGFSAVWDNDQLWGLFGNYTGQYHPNLGCLEQFNIGSANGTWTIRIIDVSPFGSGIISKINLIFCEDEGVECLECRLDPGVVDVLEYNFCQNANLMLPEVNTMYNNFPKDTNVYYYANTIFKDSVLISIQDHNNFGGQLPGDYKVCGFQYAKSDSLLIPNPILTTNVNLLNAYFNENSICAKVSDSCYFVHIFAPTDTLFLTRNICKGDTLTIADNKFTQSGQYAVNIPGPFCDTILNLTVQLVDLIANITSDTDSLSCTRNTITLQGANLGTWNTSIDYVWSTMDGIIISNPSGESIDIQSAGVYQLNVISGLCNDSTTIEIFLDETIPFVEITGIDTLTCRNDTLTLGFNTSIPIENATWSSVQPFESIGTEINVYQPGLYVLTVETSNGCVGFANVNIFSNQTFEDFELIVSDTITCLRDSVNINVIHPINRNFSYIWTGVKPAYINEFLPFIDQGGIVSVLVEDVNTGCVKSSSIEVFEDKNYPTLSINVEDLTCVRLSVTPDLNSDIPIETTIWSGQGLQDTASTVQISTPGTYNVNVTTIEGCNLDYSFQVNIDTVKAEFSLSADSLSCVNDSVKIIVTTLNSIDNFSWIGPVGFISGPLSPFVTLSGVYELFVVGNNGCLSKDTIEIVKSYLLPNILFSAGPITCEVPEVTISPDKEIGYHFLWEAPSGNTFIETSPTVSMPGIYYVTITDLSNPDCVEYNAININDGRILANIVVTTEELTCAKDSSLITYTTDIPITKSTILGPSFYIENIDSFYVKLPGIYIIEVQTEGNCFTIDSFEVIKNDVDPIIDLNQIPTITCKDNSVFIIGKSDIPGTQFTFIGPPLFGTQQGGQQTTSYPGEYELIGIAPNFCVDTFRFTINIDTISPIIEIIGLDTITCFNESFTLTSATLSGNATFMWGVNPVGDMLEVTQGGTYIVEATLLSNGCKATKVVEVIEDKVFAEYTKSASTISCSEPLSNVVIENLNFYNDIIWSTSNPEIINNGVLNFTTSLGDKYVFEIESETGCISKDSIMITFDTLSPKVSSIEVDTINCFRDVAQIKITTENLIDKIIWNGPGINDVKTNILEVTEQGIYFAYLIGLNGCVKDTFVEVLNDKDLPVFEVFTDTLSCKKGKAFIGILSNDNLIDYFWTGPSFQSPLPNNVVSIAGEYRVTVTKANGCKATKSLIVVGDFDVPIATIQDTFLIPCDSSVISLILNTNDLITQYLWAIGAEFYSNLSEPTTNQSGNYTIQITGENGCKTTLPFFVKQSTVPPGFTFDTDYLNCIKTTAILSASSDIENVSYLWISPSGNMFTNPTIEVSEGGIFRLFVSDVNNCFDSVTVVVDIDTIKPISDIIQLGQIKCETNEIELEATPRNQNNNYTYRWFANPGSILTNTTDSIVKIRGEGIYIVHTTDLSNGCIGRDSIPVTRLPVDFNLLNTTVVQPLCPSFNFGSIFIDTLNGTGPYRILLNRQSYSNQLEFNLLQPGDYTLEVTDSFGCKLETKIQILQPDDLTADLPEELIILFGDSIELSPNLTDFSPEFYTISWFENDVLICTDSCFEPIFVSPIKNTIYKLVIKSKDGKCSLEKKIFIVVNDKILNSIPNIISISASNDNNRVFYMPQTRGIEKIISLSIFDKWASPMYVAYDFLPGDPAFGWDGRYKGVDVEQGVYVVLMTLELTDGRIIEYQGDVTVLK